MNRTILPTILSALLLTSVAQADESLAQQIDAVAPIVNAGDLDDLGGPSTAAELLQDIDGRWFTLANTVRNWGRDGDDTRATLERAIERLCSDEWENLVTYQALGVDRFRIEQVSPTGEDQGTFEMVSTDPATRVFSTIVDEDYLLAISGLTEAEPAQQKELLDDFKAVAEQGVEVWRPGPDLWVNRNAAEIEVWGRCPR
ncbi:hypothetical protein [Devosia lacusdianchii]|uniref:hypothetical protein n=1 Tax=Devosia lacusdianchii TaxID=2917991 RepID=UPI001F06B451|nr:hypothetical protein [Devosia sp. JXJ CY 41]